MSKRVKLEKHQLVTVPALDTEPNSGLLETFNNALSSIIDHREKSTVLHSEVQDVELKSKKRPKPLIWFPDETVRSSSEQNLDSYSKITSQVTCEGQCPIKEEDHFDEFQEWIDGNAKCRYRLSVRGAQSHSSGWAMKYTNNHNKFVLKKTCVGVLMCSKNCSLKDRNKVMIRPAISDKVRERQLDQPCPNSECISGRIIHRKCTGNNGYPVTHFWVHHMDYVQFEAKGKHDHPKPEAKRMAIRKKEVPNKYSYNLEDNMIYYPNFYPTNEELQTFHHYQHSTEPRTFAACLEFHHDCIKTCDVTQGNEHVCFASPHMCELASETFGHGRTNFSKAYVLCRILGNFVHGFDLLESRLVSCVMPECPLILMTLYREGTVDGVIEHMKHLAVMCSSCDQKICVPKWHFLVHDFSQDLQSLAVETIVNLLIDSQMQTLLDEFQYKSVSSLYKMLRQRILGKLRSFEEHFMICKYELMLRIQDPLMVASCEELFSRLQSHYFTAKEFINTDALIKDGVFGLQVLEFWNFWGSKVISPAVFPVAKVFYAPIMHSSSYCSNQVVQCQGPIYMQDAFAALIDWLEKHKILYSPSNVWIHSYQKQQQNSGLSNWNLQHLPKPKTAQSHRLPLILSYGPHCGKQVQPFATVSDRGQPCYRT